MKRMRVVIGVYNISGYLLAGLRELINDADIMLVQSPAPQVRNGFEELCEQLEWIDCNPRQRSAEIVQRVRDWKPDIFLCSGWAFPLFLDMARVLHRDGCVNVLMLDTVWRGDLRQWLHCCISRFYLTPLFDYGWGFGRGQLENLRHLGFPRKRRVKGCFAADTEQFLSRAVTARETWPHRFLYVGRYAEAKNLPMMWGAFLNALDRCPASDWEMLCVGGGKGPVWDARPEHPRIRHLGYCPPSQLAEVVQETGCFVLPSRFEPWGLVVQEFAIMGLPLICSSAVHATEDYLKDGENGYIFDSASLAQLTEAFVRIMQMDDDGLRKMGLRSQQLGLRYTSADWAKQVQAFADRSITPSLGLETEEPLK